MDPLSLTAAAIGIANTVTIVNQTFRLISSLKNAPSEFLDLQNEVNIYHLNLNRNLIDTLLVCFFFFSNLLAVLTIPPYLSSWRQFEATWTFCDRY